MLMLLLDAVDFRRNESLTQSATYRHTAEASLEYNRLLWSKLEAINPVNYWRALLKPKLGFRARNNNLRW